jgi:hypothetical protein
MRILKAAKDIIDRGEFLFNGTYTTVYQGSTIRGKTIEQLTENLSSAIRRRAV